LLAVLDQPGTLLFDTDRPDPDTGAVCGLLFRGPTEILEVRTAADVRALPERLDEAVRAGKWVAGALSYEAAYALEPHVFAPPEGDGLLGWFGVYASPLRLGPEEVDALFPPTPYRLLVKSPALDAGAYAERIDRIRHHIREGDVYQINLTFPFGLHLDGDPVALYGALRRKQRVSYGAYLNFGELRVLSRSPELFVRLDGDRLTARPMKGTAPRGATPEEDRAAAAALSADEKNRAENLMIVDLLRNDLSRVADPGSVQVPALFQTEAYETLLQMTSTVTAHRRPDVGVGDVLRALFPCGSITGAPKLRAMSLIRELEVSPRGFYCGTLGYAGPGEAAFNVPIRTATLRRDGAGWAGTVNVGSGVVWDSEAASEYDECLLKARFLTDLAASTERADG